MSSSSHRLIDVTSTCQNRGETHQVEGEVAYLSDQTKGTSENVFLNWRIDHIHMII